MSSFISGNVMKWLMMVDPKSEMFRQASCIMGLKEGKISTSQNGEKGRSRQREVSKAKMGQRVCPGPSQDWDVEG